LAQEVGGGGSRCGRPGEQQREEELEGEAGIHVEAGMDGGVIEEARWADEGRRDTSGLLHGRASRRQHEQRGTAACAPKEEELTMDDMWVPSMIDGPHC